MASTEWAMESSTVDQVLGDVPVRSVGTGEGGSRSLQGSPGRLRRLCHQLPSGARHLRHFRLEQSEQGEQGQQPVKTLQTAPNGARGLLLARKIKVTGH